jgi:short-subunit dehydrogenase
MSERWRGRTALVTGASAGIGSELARQLAAGGANLVLTARRRERLEELRDGLAGKHGVGVEVVSADLSEPDGAPRLVEEVRGLGRHVDLLVNNAGYGLSGPFRANEWERERRMIQLNVTAPVELTKLLLPAMLERRSGDVLMVSSIAGFLAIPTFAVYAATKAFLLSFSVALGHELRGSGVRVTVVCPGGTDTEFLQVGGFTPTRWTRMGLMSAEAVASRALRAMARGRRYTITGLMNRFFTGLARLMPLALRLRAAVLFQKLAGGHT